ncbi:hypothetical protein C8R47DRAFT_1234528 [Mycena vitilis]|nr:hypothetical protein C8R47DRAFT_1234528 [Mycena vitilis]
MSALPSLTFLLPPPCHQLALRRISPRSRSSHHPSILHHLPQDTPSRDAISTVSFGHTCGNLGLGFPLPSGASVEAWFTLYIFRRGPCAVCRRDTAELPYSVSLDIRICSSACAYQLLGRHMDEVDQYLPEVLIKQPSNLSHEQVLVFASRPYLEGTQDGPVYRPSYVSADLIGTDLQSRMNTAVLLQEGITRYRSKKRIVEEGNRAFVARLAQESGLTYDQLTMSPTLAHYFTVFSRDLTDLSDMAGISQRKVCFGDIFRSNTHKNTGQSPPLSSIRALSARPPTYVYSNGPSSSST